jgi:hypothetical protein
MQAAQFEPSIMPSAPAALQTFAAESDRTRLSPVAVTAFLALCKAWRLQNKDAAELLSVSSSTFDRMKRGERIALGQDQLTRVSALVGIFKGLHLMFDGPIADEWPLLSNTGPLFKGMTPVAAMKEGGIPKMLDARRYVDAARGGL